MILIFNLHKNIEFIIKIFSSELGCFETIAMIGSNLPTNKDSYQIQAIINTLFLDEYKFIFFRKPKSIVLEKFYISEQLKFQDELQKGIYKYTKENYATILDFIMNLSISENELIPNENFELNKNQIIQSIIRIVFSKEKYTYLNNNNLNKESDSYFEYIFFMRLIYKIAYSTNELDKIFSEDNTFIDILKTVFVLFGNETIYKSYVLPVKKLINKCENLNQGLMAIYFRLFLNEMLIELKETLPYTLKIILKLVYSISQEVCGSNPLNFSVIYYLLFDSFLLSPRVQYVFDIHVNDMNILFSLENLIRRIYLNKKFEENEEMEDFNDIIEMFHKKIKAFIVENIISISEKRKDVKDYLRNHSYKKELMLPKFLFYLDCENVIHLIPGGVKENTFYATVKINK